jgi:tetratricopeptide (TPR) repeat protein
MTKLEKAQSLIESGDVEQGWELLKQLLEHHPNDPHLLIAASYTMQLANNWPVAYHLAKSTTQIMPTRSEPWLNLSAACDQLYQLDEGLEAARKAVELADTPKLKASALMNLASILINNGRYEEAEPITRESLAINPASAKSRGNLGMSLLAQGKWKEGWENYSHCLGLNQRKKIDYGLPDWSGEKGTVIVYGEQGLGDEISFASMLPDACKDADIVVDCDYRLKGLFARAFPKALVHGGRWRQTYQGGDYQCAIGELGRFYRNVDSDFQREPYLVADPVRRAQWQYLKDQVKKPLIGIAWTGGMAHTASKYRQLTRIQLQAIVQGIDAHFVSLEYKEREPVHGINVYPHATLTDDYDDAAALVAECDVVITVQTAVAHLAGALGVPCVVMVPETSQWRYHPKTMLWYGENFKVHKGEWDINGVIEDAKRIIGLMGARQTL